MPSASRTPSRFAPAPVAVAIAIAALSFTSSALASELRISTLEHHSWPASVAALQADVASESRTIHVTVDDSTGEPVPCTAYSLAFDTPAAEAFAIGACDPTTDATAVTLVHRAALFDRDDVVAYPRHPMIRATEYRTGAAAGGAAESTGSEVTCSVAIRPYLDDLERGRRIYLTAPRFVVRSREPGVAIDGTPTGWAIHSGRRADLVIEYDVVDTVRNRIVLHERATMTCAVAPVTEPVVSDEVPPPPPPSVPVARSNNANVSIQEAHVVIEGASVVVRGNVSISAGGSLVIRNGGSLVITR